jgi:hypothetical protein
LQRSSFKIIYKDLTTKLLKVSRGENHTPPKIQLKPKKEFQKVLNLRTRDSKKFIP